MSPEWPFPGEAAHLRARRVAWAYRALAEKQDPGGVAELDDRFARQWGEGWIAPDTNFEPDDLVTAEQAARILGVTDRSVLSARSRGKLTGYPDGRRYRFKVAELWAFDVERRKHWRHQKAANGEQQGEQLQ